MLVALMCLAVIAITVSMWPDTYRTISNWSALPTSVFQCSDDRVLTSNRLAKVRAIFVVFFSPWGIPALLFVAFGR